MDSDIRAVVITTLGAFAGGGGGLLFISTLLKRRWERHDSRETSHATVEVKGLEIDQEAMKLLASQVHSLQERMDTREAAWQKRFDEQSLFFQTKIDRLQEQVDDWKGKYYAASERIGSLQNQVDALTRRNAVLETDYAALLMRFTVDETKGPAR